MLDKLWRKSTAIQLLKTFSRNDSPWENDAAVFFIKNGLARLRMECGLAKDHRLKVFLDLNDTPLIKIHSIDENLCPTCEKLISAGYGLGTLSAEEISTIRTHLNRPYESISSSLDELRPILNLLKSGFYALADLPLLPSDGNGNLFWNQTNIPVPNKGSRWIHLKGFVAEGQPTFLLASQPPNRIDEETVNAYREKIRAGEPLHGLAYYIGYSLCVLLDGHHKALAAALEGQKLRCLTILPVHSESYEQNRVDYKISLGGVWFNTESLSSNADNLISKGFFCYDNLSVDEVEQRLSQSVESWDQYQWPQATLEAGRKYPNAFALACAECAGDLSSDRIDRLLRSEEEDSIEKLQLIMNSLIGLHDDRAFSVVKRIAKNRNYCLLWHEAFQFLSTIKTEEVESFFIDFLIDDDKTRPELTKIADAYLAAES
ncbi:hypothetical protein [Azotosporobacter soli]|uniref:hypothetical protein n=1 Tax=Azotosporobacter soli TaxID=3055040 RepID=UPI0031FEE90C